MNGHGGFALRLSARARSPRRAWHQTFVAGLCVGVIYLSSPGAAQTSGSRASLEVRGKRLFLACQACHALVVDAPPKAGPNLSGVTGREAATAPNFNYSTALRSAKITWTDVMLDRWLQKPNALVSGTTMAYPGMDRPEDRAAIIAFLKQAR